MCSIEGIVMDCLHDQLVLGIAPLLIGKEPYILGSQSAMFLITFDPLHLRISQDLILQSAMNHIVYLLANS